MYSYMTITPTLRCCRMCGATSYRPVIARDAQGALRATDLFQCSGCSVVFTDPKAWREGGDQEPPPPTITPMRPYTVTATGPRVVAPAATRPMDRGVSPGESASID